jgi:hypothetical protein
MHAIPRAQRSPVLTAALPRTDSEAFLVDRDHAVATLAPADLRAAIRNGHCARSGRRCRRRLARRLFI